MIVEEKLIEFTIGEYNFVIDEHSELRPICAGSKEPRAIQDDDDLRKVVFLSPDWEIWA